MRNYRVLFVTLGALLLCSSAFAQGSLTVFVTDGTGGHIYNFTPPTTTSPTTVATISGATLKGLTYGPDGKLYVCDPKNGVIRRMNPDGTTIETVFMYTSSGPHSPDCGRFDSMGNFYVTDEFANSGVWKFSKGSLAGTLPATPTNVFTGAQLGGTTPAPFGGDADLTHSNQGDLLILDSNNGRVISSANVPGPLVSGLDHPTGIARSSTGDIFIAEQGSSNKIVRYTSTGTLVGDCGIFGATTGGADTPDIPFLIKFSADDTLDVATSRSDSDDETDPFNTGKIWKVNPGACANAPTLIANMPTPPSESEDERLAAIGIALPPTTTALKGPKPVSGSTNFNFGFTSFTITDNSSCNATISVSQTLQSDLSTAVAGISPPVPAGTNLVPYLGEAAFGTLYHVTSNCLNANTLIGAFTPKLLNPHIVQCHPSIVEGTCTALDPNAVYPLGGPIPGDGGVGTKPPNFSDFFVIDEGLSTAAGVAGTFCGFQFPLTTTENPATARKFDEDDFILISFRLAAAGHSCSSGPFVDNAKVVVSLSRIDPGFAPITNSENLVTSTINGALFFHTYFGLISLEDLPVGTYDLSLFFPNGNSAVVDTIFKIVREGTPGSF